MVELIKLKIFKKILYLYSPSKNLIVKMPWVVNNFFYGAIGNKLFKLLSDTQEGIEILDSPNEDTILIFQKANSWIKDVMQCLEEILERPDNEEHPFHIKKINNTLSRNIFIFIGIISNSKLGDDYLYKQGFYSLLNKFIINKSNKYDYLITLLISQYLFYLITIIKHRDIYNILSLIIIPFIWIVLVYFTFNPRHTKFFFDPIEEVYGIPKKIK